ncbi:uncharacterized protein LOC112528513 [Cynara cardunculus var. scolymus]|uniref:Fringe-like protein n=1 Tax=Cynara cardunculus var. scolymus TaxID=59895 RepID=A0A118JWR9_CYNCS|nr:uncharacterized protein LOC112528513 [Cynara cardunculus var. scolymus]KVH95949.1 Protein of unknown function DUF604 [Cynara cardunculus var. scolymus]
MKISHLFFKTHLNTRLINLIFIFSSLGLILYLLFSSFSILPNTRILLLSDRFSSPTSLDHIVFGIASNAKSWPKRKEYVKMWWKPDKMRGCAFLDVPLENNTVSSDVSLLPPVCISDDTSRFRYTWRGGLRSAIRVARVVSETVALNHSNVRWFVFGDDDTVFFPENLVKTLSKYDHDLMYFIGSNSESFIQNRFFSFSMAFGGAGFAISYPLAKTLAKVLDSCLERYPHLYGSDGRISSCLAELGIGITREAGFHQMDMTGNPFGVLAAHPMTPLVSLHHTDYMDPIFPKMTNRDAMRHLYKAAELDPHRILQQAVCYDRWFSWTISVSWGYAVEVFGNHVLLPDVLRVPATFRPWKKGNLLNTLFSFDMREHNKDPCRRPVVFHMNETISEGDHTISIYKLMAQDNCTSNLGSPRRIEMIKVRSQKLNLDQKQAPRRQCCDVLPSSRHEKLEIGIRQCREDELIRMQ